MTGLLTAAAVITTIILLVSATHSATSVTASDPCKRGSWGIASWKSSRNRPLDPHERRWETGLLSGKDNGSRWRDLVGEIETLERLSGTTPAGQAPQEFDANWVEAALSNLETVTQQKATYE